MQEMEDTGAETFVECGRYSISASLFVSRYNFCYWMGWEEIVTELQPLMHPLSCSQILYTQLKLSLSALYVSLREVKMYFHSFLTWALRSE
jgi:hypothetical protein